MIIRSQDKTSTTTDLNLKIYEDDWTHNFEITNDSGMGLGEYSTEEKAIKVLDMICEEYVKYTSLEDVLGSVHGIHILPKYFQMPKDNEVEV